MRPENLPGDSLSIEVRQVVAGHISLLEESYNEAEAKLDNIRNKVLELFVSEELAQHLTDLFEEYKEWKAIQAGSEDMLGAVYAHYGVADENQVC